MARFLITRRSTDPEGFFCTVLFLDEPSKRDRDLLESSMYEWHDRADRGKYGPYRDMSPIRWSEDCTTAQWSVELRAANDRILESMLDVLNYVDQGSQTRIVEVILGWGDDVPRIPWPSE